MGITMTLDNLARELGERAREAFVDEFGYSPRTAEVGDWDSAAFAEDRRTLTDAGMDRENGEECWEAWRAGFFGR